MTGYLRILLYPLSLIYGMVIWIRNYLFDHGFLESEEFRVPVICVGNITVGGTGKTPHIEYLIELLSGQFRIAVLSRGYKRGTKGFLIAGNESSFMEIGDEPRQMKTKYPDIIVAVDESRRRGIRTLIDQYPDIDLILLDDAFQHRWVNPGLSILLTDFGRLITRDHLLPYGRLREQGNNRRRADIIIVSKSPADLLPIDRRIIVREISPETHQNLYFTSISYSEPRNIHSEVAAGLSMDTIRENKTQVLLVTGIANAAPLKSHIEKFAGHVVHLNFSDHHHYTPDDLNRIKECYDNLQYDNRCILTTEKDSTRFREMKDLPSLFDDNFYYLPIRTGFLNDDQDEFNNLIIQYVRKNKHNRIVS